MTEVARKPNDSSAVERGEVPEVAALCNALTELFNTLGISQSAYAVRVSLDKSIVSRYLRGRRIPPPDFIDRLLREVGGERGVPVRPEAKSRVTQLRLEALKVCDPAAHELETLRAEMEQSQRQVQVLVRHQEALHVLLDKKESEALFVQGELEQVRQDWTGDLLRAHRTELELREHVQRHSAEREDLVEEISKLKSELSDVATLRAEAELRCGDLESRVKEMEEELAAARSESGSGSRLPLAALQGQLAAFLEAGEQREVTREIAQAAWERPVEEVVELVFWFWKRGDFSRRDRLVTEVVHSRSVDEITEFGHSARRAHDMPRPRTPGLVTPLTVLLNQEVVAVRAPQDIATLHARWEEHWEASSISPTSRNLLTALIRSDRNVDEVAEVISRLDPGDELANRLIQQAASRSYRRDNFLALVPRLVEIEREDLVLSFCSALIPDDQRRLRTPDFMALGRMSEAHCRLLSRAVLRVAPLEAVIMFLAGLCASYKAPNGNSVTEGSPAAIVFDDLRSEGHLVDVAAFAERTKGRKQGLPSASATVHKSLKAWAATDD